MHAEPRATIASLIAAALIGGLLAATVMSPVVAAGPVTKKKVKKIATTLDGKIGARVGYAFDSANRSLDVSAGGAAKEQLTTSVTAPAPGFLVLDLWMDSDNDTEDERFSCYFRVDGVKVQSSQVEIRLTAGNDDENCTTHGVVPVNAGPHTVALVTDEVTSSATDTEEIGLSAVYVPFDGTGARPTDFTVARDR